MENQEKLAAVGTQDKGQRYTKQKHNTICVEHHYAQTCTNNVNKTCVFLLTTRGKDEPNIVFMRTSQHETQNVITHNRTIQKKLRR